MRKIILLLTALFASHETWAYCVGGRYPNIGIGQELRQSDFVVIGKLLTARHVVDRVADPEGYEATLFQVKILKVISGRPPAYVVKSYFTVYNENTSARFPIDDHDLGKEYVMFVSAGPDGYEINSCGNSGELGKSKQMLESIVRARRK